MTREEIIAQVNSLLAEEFEVEESEFTPDANLKETLSLDNINLVDLIALVQFNYKITIPCRGPEEDPDLQQPLRLH